MTNPILTIYNEHSEQCGKPPSFSNEAPGVYIGYFENFFGEQWIFTFDRETRVATMRGGDVDWEKEYVVRDGRVAGLIFGKEELVWLAACWKAACG
jgi:hypothetical protein